MNKNFKRIFSVILSIFVCIPVFIISVSADLAEDNHDKLAKRKEAVVGGLPNINSFLDQKKPYNQFKDDLDFYINGLNGDDSYIQYVADFYKRIGDSISSLHDVYGDDVAAAADYLLGPLFDQYKTYESKSTFDTQGYGACVELVTKRGNSNEFAYSRFYGDYIILEPIDDVRLRASLYPHALYTVSVSYDGDVTTGGERFDWAGWQYRPVPSQLYAVHVYGDVRTPSGDPAESDDEYVETGVYNYDNATDVELLDLLKDILEKLNLEMPDLSSIEGLLEAIYHRLGTLDSDDDNNILSLINSSIIRLQTSNDTNSSLLLEKLESLFGSKEDEDPDTDPDKDPDKEPEEDVPNVDLAELKELIEQLIPDIDDMSGTEKVKAAFIAKFAFIEELKSLIQSFIDSYKNGSNDPVITVDFSSFGAVSWVAGLLGYHDIDLSGGGILDKYMPSVRALIAAFIYISFAWRLYKKIPDYISGGGD